MKLIIALIIIAFGAGCSHPNIHTGCDVVGKQSNGKLVTECQDEA
jgi:hypothetical protein